MEKHALRASDSLAKALASITLGRHACLCSPSLTVDTRVQGEDLPFEGAGIFNNKMDECLEKSKETRSTAQLLGLYPTARRTPTPSSTEVQKWLLIGAVKEIGSNTEERGEGFHSILDLTKLNRFIWKFWFKKLILASIVHSLSVMD